MRVAAVTAREIASIPLDGCEIQMGMSLGLQTDSYQTYFSAQITRVKELTVRRGA